MTQHFETHAFSRRGFLIGTGATAVAVVVRPTACRRRSPPARSTSAPSSRSARTASSPSPCPASEMGQGTRTALSADPRRGPRRRLEQGPRRAGAGQRQALRQSEVQRPAADRRQLLRHRLLLPDAARRRAGPQGAARQRGRGLEGAGRGADHRARHGGARQVEPEDRLRRSRQDREGARSAAGDHQGGAEADLAVPPDRQGHRARSTGRRRSTAPRNTASTCNCRTCSTPRCSTPTCSTRRPSTSTTPRRKPSRASCKIVPLPVGVGVIADTVEGAMRAKSLLKVTWTKAAPGQTYTAGRRASPTTAPSPPTGASQASRW